MSMSRVLGTSDPVATPRAATPVRARVDPNANSAAAFFPTETKVTTHRPEPELLTGWQQGMEIPCVAIGGITPDNAAGLAAAGADFVAVSAAVWRHPDGPAAAVRQFNQVLAAAF